LFEPGVMVTSVPWQLRSSRVQPQLISGDPDINDASDKPFVHIT
jgi:hypothetical protein